MKIYLAARYSRREELKGYRELLQSRGHVVTSSWIDTDLEGRAADEEREKVAIVDLNDLRSSEACISFTEPPDAKAGRGGRHVEFGLAYALGLVCVVVGHRENVFHHLPDVHFVAIWSESVLALFRPQAQERKT